MKEIVITGNEAGQRFDKFLAKFLNEAPKSFIYKMLRKKNIVLNGKKASGDEKIIVGDVVKLFLSDETIDKFSSINIQRTQVQLDVIYEDQDVIFINKPSGMLSQKAEQNDASVVEHVISYLLNNNQITEGQLQTFKPSVCNRLDRNTSGLITAGKSLAGLQGLSECFRNRSMGKYYLAIVQGQVTKEERLHGYLMKDSKTNKVTIKEQIADTQENAKESYIETEYKPLWSNRELSLLEVHLITGKPHQIRAHLASIGHGIIGDFKYGDKKVNTQYKEVYGMKSQLLHAYRLEFPANIEVLTQLGGKRFIAPLPQIYKEVLRQVGGPYEHLEFTRT